ncbi:unnamed protein product, partial [Prunus brigantina]
LLLLLPSPSVIFSPPLILPPLLSPLSKMKPSHVNAFARHFLNGLTTSFKQTIIVCEKLAPGEVVIKVSLDDYKHVNTLLNEEDTASSLSLGMQK